MSDSSPKGKEVCVVITGSIDVGKCFGKGTKILKYNGTIEDVENLIVGDLLMGDDSRSRSIIETHHGESDLYEIETEDNKKYVVNDEHLLYLYNIQTQKTTTVSVNNFMDLEDKSIFRWCRTDVEFPLQDCQIDPFIFGMWVTGSKVNIPDRFIVDYGLSNVKSIPNLFKYNSKVIRGQLLNGIIVNKLNIPNDSEKLIDDIIWVANSLGFHVKMNRLNQNLTIDFVHQTLFQFHITKKGKGQYYGFAIDQNERFLLDDFSIVHNSSFLGVITTGELDNGKGYARSKIAKHPHEIKEGKTSDISTRTIDFNGNHVTLVDLCGHEKYLKTTLFGITGFFPDYGILLISANRGLLKMTKEHMGILLYLRIPFMILITRVDIAPQNIYEGVIDNTCAILKKFKRDPLLLNNVADSKLTGDNLVEKEKECLEIVEKFARKMKNNHFAVPIISISNKTGYFINVVRHIFSKLEPREIWGRQSVNGSIFYIDSKFTPTGIGLVVSGILKGLPINVGSEMLIGPYGSEFKKIKVWSLHDNNKNSVPFLEDRQRGCLAIKPVEKKEDVTKFNIRKGMLIVSKETEQNLCYQFTAEIEVLSHSTVISSKYTPVIHCGIVRQSAKIILNSGQVLKMGDRAEISFRFVKHPEFIEKGSIFFFREGTTRGVGVVKSILHLNEDPNKNPAYGEGYHKKKKILRSTYGLDNYRINKILKKGKIEVV